MFGQIYTKYDIFPILNSPEIEEQIKELKLIQLTKKPDHDQEYYIYEYNMLKSVSLEYLMECLPFIKITFAQLLLILRNIILTLEKYFKIGLIPDQLDKNNVYLILGDQDPQFTYYFQKRDYQIQFIGIKWQSIQMNKNNVSFEACNPLIKNLAMELYIIYQQKYEKQLKTSEKDLINSFQFNFYLHSNILNFLEHFLEKFKYNKELQYFPNESKSLREYEKKINNQIQQGQEIINNQISKVQQNIQNKGFAKNFINQTLSLLQQDLYGILYSLLEPEIGAYYISDKIDKFKEKVDRMLKTSHPLFSFDNKKITQIFQDQYNQNICLKEYFSRFYVIEIDWVSKLDRELGYEIFNIARKQMRINNYSDVLKVFNYFIQYPQNKNQGIQTNKNQEIQTINLNNKSFEPVLIKLLGEYINNKIEKLF